MEVTGWGPQVKLPTQHRLTEDPGMGEGPRACWGWWRRDSWQQGCRRCSRRE